MRSNDISTVSCLPVSTSGAPKLRHWCRCMLCFQIIHHTSRSSSECQRAPPSSWWHWLGGHSPSAPCHWRALVSFKHDGKTRGTMDRFILDLFSYGYVKFICIYKNMYIYNYIYIISDNQCMQLCTIESDLDCHIISVVLNTCLICVLSS